MYAFIVPLTMCESCKLVCHGLNFATLALVMLDQDLNEFAALENVTHLLN